MAEPIIQCENLVKIYKTKDIEVLALQGLEITIEKGELMAIIGNSGSGKSTFLNMIGGLDRPSAGRLIVDGKDLFKLTDSELVQYKRETVGFVWQNNARNLLPWLSAWQNVQTPMLFGTVKQKKKRAFELLDLVGLGHRANSRLSQLSGGEQQRVAIAIALANNPKLLLAKKPKLLLCDEPTKGLDAVREKILSDIFRKLKAEGITIVIVTHDRMLSAKVNRVVSIRDGKTSSERIMKQSYLEQYETLGKLALDGAQETQEEFAVLDRVGRLQIPQELLQKAGISGNKVRLDFENGRITLGKPGENE